MAVRVPSVCLCMCESVCVCVRVPFLNRGGNCLAGSSQTPNWSAADVAKGGSHARSSLFERQSSRFERGARAWPEELARGRCSRTASCWSNARHRRWSNARHSLVGADGSFVFRCGFQWKRRSSAVLLSRLQWPWRCQCQRQRQCPCQWRCQWPCTNVSFLFNPSIVRSMWLV